MFQKRNELLRSVLAVDVTVKNFIYDGCVLRLAMMGGRWVARAIWRSTVID